MDRLLYVTMTGAKASMERQERIANNLANVNTPGFKEIYQNYKAVPTQTANPNTYNTRTYTVAEDQGISLKEGSLDKTENPLDVAFIKNTFVSVQAGPFEAYTKNGNLQLSPQGYLTDSQGRPILGQNGVITATTSNLLIKSDGTIIDQNSKQVLDKLKLVELDAKNIQHGQDGLYRTKDGKTPTALEDTSGRVLQGYIEKSNVDVAKQMVDMVKSSRHFDLQMKMMDINNENTVKSMKLLNLD